MDDTEKLSAWTEAERKVNTAERRASLGRKKCVVVAQSCPTLCNPVDHSLPGFALHGILQVRILEWVAISFSRASSWPRDWTQGSNSGLLHCRQIFFFFFLNPIWATWEALGFHYHELSKEVIEHCREVTKSITTKLAQVPPGCSSGGLPCDCLLTHERENSVLHLQPPEHTSALVSAVTEG